MGRSVINFSLICLLASFCFASEDRSRSTTVKVEADPSKGFSYPYYLHVPPNVRDEKSKSRIHSLLVIPNNTGKISEKLYSEMNLKAKFKLYPNAGHKVTKEMLKDVLSFLSKHKA